MQRPHRGREAGPAMPRSAACVMRGVPASRQLHTASCAAS